MFLRDLPFPEKRIPEARGLDMEVSLRRVKMSKQLIPHVFASVQTLERYVETIRAKSSGHPGLEADLKSLLPQFESFLVSMRRVANKLQLQVASKDALAIARSLKVFYGLNHIVRPEILSVVLSITQCAERPKVELAASETH